MAGRLTIIGGGVMGLMREGLRACGVRVAENTEPRAITRSEGT